MRPELTATTFAKKRRVATALRGALRASQGFAPSHAKESSTLVEAFIGTALGASNLAIDPAFFALCASAGEKVKTGTAVKAIRLLKLNMIVPLLSQRFTSTCRFHTSAPTADAVEFKYQSLAVFANSVRSIGRYLV
jgi:hypothetical protein